MIKLVVDNEKKKSEDKPNSKTKNQAEDSNLNKLNISAHEKRALKKALDDLGLSLDCPDKP